MSCHCGERNPAVVTSRVARRLVRALPRRPTRRLGSSQDENWSARTRTAARDHDPGALHESCLLVCPVIERGGADHEIEGFRRPGQPLGGTLREVQSVVGGHSRGDFDHRCRGVDPGQFGRLRAADGQLPEQVAGPAPHVQDPLRHRRAGERKARGTVCYLVMQPTAPAVLVAPRPLLECGNITIPSHGLIMAVTPSLDARAVRVSLAQVPVPACRSSVARTARAFRATPTPKARRHPRHTPLAPHAPPRHQPSPRRRPPSRPTPVSASYPI